MTFSPKQIRSLHDSNARINIWEGSVRSGKTFISLWRFVKELKYGSDGNYLIITRTYDSFKRNILDILTNIVHANSKYYAGKREIHIFNKVVHIVGADDERSESKIRGLTAAGAYVDEISIIPHSVWQMLISRCAMGNAKIFGTTNPDSPFHWLKVDFLEKNPDVKSWKFVLDDNPELTKEEKEYLKRQYKGLWYQRFIEGLWVQAEGSIYDTFDNRLHVIDFPPGAAEYYIVGVDYGTSNPCSFVLIGYSGRRFPNMWVEEEYYYDSKIHQRQKTDSEYAEDLREFIKNKPIKAIYIDPSAASFKLELQKIGVQNLYDAENEVIDGIRFVAKLFNNGTLKLTAACKNLLQEIKSYVWDAKSQKTGIDKPLKEHDHSCVVGETIVLTEIGYRRIDSLVGTKAKLASFDKDHNCVVFSDYFHVHKTQTLSPIFELELEDGTTIQATRDHKFLTQSGWKELQDLTQSDIVFTWNTKSFKKTNIISTLIQGIGLALKHLIKGFMSLFGNR